MGPLKGFLEGGPQRGPLKEGTHVEQGPLKRYFLKRAADKSVLKRILKGGQGAPFEGAWGPLKRP